ncbi:cellulase family glycosylhydrolase [Geothrix sp. PMB-07]|uniref:cellulase family glycosylhydrolase n=1 Tax=Geothrix sp. PMB-07 TaxID=3068640 RepID=UPI00274104B7|nr:cellulase family glycosylhydrolase [Geothrix sp. PMB-07]WLT32366.1 cellulase family glycosylhydrolase [Geothrix sp. PMB-07]
MVRRGILTVCLSLAAWLGLGAAVPKADGAQVAGPVNGGGHRFLKVVGTEIREASGTGKTVVWRGTNLGGWLLQEAWMTPMMSGQELPQADEWHLRALLAERFGEATRDRLVSAFQDTWIQEADLDAIQALGLNLVRVPFLYMDLLAEDGSLKAGGTRRLDWIIEACGRRGLYVLLDLHGAPGCQNRWDNSGRINADPQLWKAPRFQDMTVKLWTALAKRYKGNPTVAGYDLLNEPDKAEGADEAAFAAQLNAFYDRLYRAIRAEDPDHILVMEAFPGWQRLGDPAAFHWTNVVYQFHSYAMQAKVGGVDVSQVWTVQRDMVERLLADAQAHRTKFQVPIFVGEFCVFGFEDLWARALAGLNRLGISWAPWTWKVAFGDPERGDAAGFWGLMCHDTGSWPRLTQDDAATLEARWRSHDTATHFSPNPAWTALIQRYASGATDLPPRPEAVRLQVRGRFVGANPLAVPFAPFGTQRDLVPLLVDRDHAADGPADWTAFTLRELGDGTLALQARLNARYLRANLEVAGRLTASSTQVGPPERFRRVDLGDGTFALQTLANGKYVGPDAQGALAAESPVPIPFTLHPLHP